MDLILRLGVIPTADSTTYLLIPSFNIPHSVSIVSYFCNAKDASGLTRGVVACLGMGVMHCRGRLDMTWTGRPDIRPRSWKGYTSLHRILF